MSWYKWHKRNYLWGLMSDFPFFLKPSECHSIGTINQYTDMGIVPKKTMTLDVVLCRLCMRFNYENSFGNCVLLAISFRQNYNSNADILTKGYAQQNAWKKNHMVKERSEQLSSIWVSVKAFQFLLFFECLCLKVYCNKQNTIKFFFFLIHKAINSLCYALAI